MNLHSYKINISGRVQGVGFRPFVFNLAKKLGVKGFVTNNTQGVLIVACASEETIDSFYQSISTDKPSSAVILSSELARIDVNESFENFTILESDDVSPIQTLLTPDFALCKNCCDEMLDRNNRRYFYPFISCTQCGPRYSITNRFPFERINTEMSAFEMCDECQAEYVDSADIRFHSQTNSCHRCGVQLRFTTITGDVLSTNAEEIFPMISAMLQNGAIVAVKSTAGYLLICDATNKDVVQDLRTRKRRPTKPFAVLFNDVESIQKNLEASEVELAALQSQEAPIVILKQKEGAELALTAISPGLNSIGAMMPNSGTLKLIAHVFGKPIIATSGNYHGSPICANEQDAIETLSGIADCFLHNSIKIMHSQDDSVLRFTRKNMHKIIMRRSRGMSPNYLETEQSNEDAQILCVGSDLKNSICIRPNSNTYISEYLGDLSDYNSGLRFEKTIEAYSDIFSFKARTILLDSHPRYFSSLFAEKLKRSNEKYDLVKVQHHQAHFAAVLGENNLLTSNKSILGVIWDGIGYGNEKEIWGGEFFVYRDKEMQRVGHVNYYPWIHGDKMSTNPKLSALAISGGDLKFRKYFDDNEWSVYLGAISNPVVVTSSMGRLFDAVAFVLGFDQPVTFEGESAIYLEQLAQMQYDLNPTSVIDYLQNEPITGNIPTRTLFEIIQSEIEKDNAIPYVALNFHYTLVKSIEKIANYNKINTLAFSGGVFQNALLVDLILDVLSSNFVLHFHKELSPNDENISFGQLKYYSLIQSKII